MWVRDTALKLRQDGMMKTKLALDYMRKSTQVYNTLNQVNKEAGWSLDVGGTKPEEDLTWLL